MKNIIVLIVISITSTFAGWNKAPGGWDDIKFGLVNDDSPYANERLAEAIKDRDIKIDYRYIYLNGGVDKNSNRISLSFNEFQNYALDSKDKVGAEAAYIVSMLQDSGDVEDLAQVVNDKTKMIQFFESIQIVAKSAKNKQSTWVIEPNTWADLLQNNQSDTATAYLDNYAHINDLGLVHLEGFDNKISNLPQAIIAHIKHYAPDAYAGIAMSFWSVDANSKVAGEYQVNDAIGFANWHIKACEYSAEVNVAFAKKLLPREEYSKGDFIGVEKNGYDAGWWKTNSDKGDYYYWDDSQMKKWLRWSELLAKGLDMPLLGWNIPIGHRGLVNNSITVDSTTEIGNGQYEDTFLPYFFAHTDEFVDIGFIGFLVGKGYANGTDYTNSTSEPEKGDKGWFLDKIVEFDKSRPWLSGGAQRYAVVAKTEGMGTISPSGTIRVDSSSNQMFTFKPDEFFIIDSVVVDSQNVGTDSYLFKNVEDTHNITVYFGIDPNYDLVTIKTNSNENGKVIPITKTVEQGGDIEVAITPNYGYIVDSLILDGVNRGSVISADFKHIYKDHDIKVFFGKNGSKGLYEAWNNEKVYPSGEMVSYNGRLYKTQQQTQGDNPKTELGQSYEKKWEDIGIDELSVSDTVITATLDYFEAGNDEDTIIITTTTAIKDESADIKIDTIIGIAPTRRSKEVNNLAKISILENGHSFTVETSGTYQINLFNLMGREIYRSKTDISQSGIAMTHLPLEVIPSGVYILHISGGGVRGTKQINIVR